MNHKTVTTIYVSGYSLLVLSTVAYIAVEKSDNTLYAVIAFGLGVLCVALAKILTRDRGTDFYTKRLNRIAGLSPALLIATTYLMYVGNNAWAVTLTIAAFVDLFVSIRSEQKDRRNNKKIN